METPFSTMEDVLDVYAKTKPNQLLEKGQRSSLELLKHQSSNQHRCGIIYLFFNMSNCPFYYRVLKITTRRSECDGKIQSFSNFSYRQKVIGKMGNMQHGFQRQCGVDFDCALISYRGKRFIEKSLFFVLQNMWSKWKII